MSLSVLADVRVLNSNGESFGFPDSEVNEHKNSEGVTREDEFMWTESGCDDGPD